MVADVEAALAAAQPQEPWLDVTIAVQYLLQGSRITFHEVRFLQSWSLTAHDNPGLMLAPHWIFLLPQYGCAAAVQVSFKAALHDLRMGQALAASLLSPSLCRPSA